jgi:DNA-binding XRE family transcriptional regulator
LARVIKRRREELGLTQAELAQQLGVHKQTIVKYEADAINISSERLLGASRALLRMG